MKKIVSLCFFVCLLFVFISSNHFIFAEENDFDTSVKSSLFNIKDKEKEILSKKISINKDIKPPIKESIIFLSENKNIDDKKKIQEYFTTELINNGNFEQGHSYWSELMYYNGTYVDASYVINTGDFYGNWGANMIGKEALLSNNFRFPDSSTAFSFTFYYKIPTITGSSCSYGDNGVDFYLLDLDSGQSMNLISYSPDFSSSRYDYKPVTLLFSSRLSLNRNLSLSIISNQDDPNCDFLFSLDNVSLESLNYVPDYTITTSAGSNGSITSGNTLAQGSSYTINVTPNSGYEIADVLVDGVSVGPVKYYTFNNLISDHSIQANFQVSNTTSQRIYRFWSDQKQHHFYTASNDEFTKVVNNYSSYVWRYESVGYRAFLINEVDTIPVYRFWSDQKQGHFYTASESEKNKVIATYPEYVWKYEGIAFYVYPADYNGASTTIYRFWSDQKQGHFYTASESEKNYIISTYPEYVWKYEGVAYKVPVLN